MTFLTHDDYTISWTVPLPIEMTAAKAMLHKVHDQLRQQLSDHNVYTLESIHGHNIVVACPPFGVFETVSAPNVVSHLVSIFPNVRLGLMVGICRGAPSRSADILLGDAVIGKPTAK